MWESVEKRGIERRGLVAGPADRPRPDLPAGTDLLPAIKHIVVLMMENHSYDNYLGMLADRGDGLPMDASGTPTAVNVLPNGQRIGAWHLPATAQVTGNPTQTWHASTCPPTASPAAGSPLRSGRPLPGADPAIPMGLLDRGGPAVLPRARAGLPVGDRWFCSCLGPTFPNRRFLISGTANGLIDDLPWDLVDYPPAGTIFDALSRYDISWVNYHSVHRPSSCSGACFGGGGLVLLRRLAALGR